MAAAMGAFGGDPALGLEVLGRVTADALKQAVMFRSGGAVGVHLLADHRGICVRVRISAGGDTAEAEIRDLHDRIVRICLNDNDIDGFKDAGGDR